MEESEERVALVLNDCFHTFESDVDPATLPEQFTFPFYYEPDPLCVRAAELLQRVLTNSTRLKHNFDQLGKMFGVLLVQKVNGEVGYLAAFSGKLGDAYQVTGFVPPVYDISRPTGFFKKGEAALNALNEQVISLQNAADYLSALAKLAEDKNNGAQAIQAHRASIKAKKSLRQQKRQAIADLDSAESAARITALENESKRDHFEHKDLKRSWRLKIAAAQQVVDQFEREIEDLKRQRKEQSGKLQQQIFAHYRFLNQAGEHKDLMDIFRETVLEEPPAGAGECAAPKLLQFAFLHKLKPLAIAEFWWGKSPKSVVRKQGNFYPACRGKCEPILGHMLKGVPIHKNPMLENPAKGKKLTYVYEDEHLLLVNKPAGFLSVPGRNIEDSVWLRIKYKYPAATGPLVVHRLDMSTSGLLLVAKTKEIHQKLQQQFIQRTIEKRYLALLEGELKEAEGKIELPLCSDYNERPRQMVSWDKGKPATTHWKLLRIEQGKSLVHFFPLTGRTHQLRVHAAHQLGLNMPIVGDDLYGKRANRLHLHAEQLAFTHPASGERISFRVATDFAN